MSARVAVILYLAAMIAVIVGVDFAFFKNRFWERLIANVGIVLVFAVFLLEIPQVLMIAVEFHDRTA